MMKLTVYDGHISKHFMNPLLHRQGMPKPRQRGAEVRQCTVECLMADLKKERKIRRQGFK